MKAKIAAVLRRLDWQEVPIAKIKPYENNPKAHSQEQIDFVAKLLQDYGWTQPVCVDRDYVLIFGHCRVLSARQIGEMTVPCVFREDLTEAQVKALRIADNKSNESEWITEKLEVEFTEIEELGMKLEDTGFKLGEIVIHGTDGIQDPSELWKDMPEFVQEDNFYQQIKVTFFSESDVKKFAKLIGQEITPKTTYLHFPKIENFKNKDFHYGS